MLEILLNRIQIMMNQSQSPTSLDLAPSLSKRRGKGTIGSQTHETSLVPAAHAADAVPYQSPAPPDFDTTASGHRVPSLVRCANERGLSEKVSLGTFSVSKGANTRLKINAKRLRVRVSDDRL